MNTNPQQYPTQFYGRTFIYWTGGLLFGPLAIFMCTAGLLSWLGIIEPLYGEPNPKAEIALMVGGLFCTLFSIACTFHVYALQTPNLTIYKEGLCILVIGTPIRFNPIRNILFGYLPALLAVLLQFKTRLVRLRWENINIVANAGTLEIGGLIDKDEYNFGQDTSPESEWHTTFFGVDSFGTPIAKVSESVQFFLHNPDARETLPSWQDEETLLGNDTFDFR